MPEGWNLREEKPKVIITTLSAESLRRQMCLGLTSYENPDPTLFAGSLQIYQCYRRDLELTIVTSKMHLINARDIKLYYSQVGKCVLKWMLRIF